VSFLTFSSPADLTEASIRRNPVRNMSSSFWRAFMSLATVIVWRSSFLCGRSFSHQINHHSSPVPPPPPSRLPRCSCCTPRLRLKVLEIPLTVCPGRRLVASGRCFLARLQEYFHVFIFTRTLQVLQRKLLTPSSAAHLREGLPSANSPFCQRANSLCVPAVVRWFVGTVVSYAMVLVSSLSSVPAERARVSFCFSLDLSLSGPPSPRLHCGCFPAGPLRTLFLFFSPYCGALS